MKVYILIKPFDFQDADAMLFTARELAEEEIQNGKRDGKENAECWFIKESYI